MALENDAQEQHAVKVGNLRSAITSYQNQMRANVETTSRQLVNHRKSLEDAIAADPDLHAAVYGDGSPGTLAATIDAEIGAVNTMVDAVIGVTTKTRADLEAGQ